MSAADESLPLATRENVERLSKMLDLMAEWLDFDGKFNDPWVNAAGGVAQVAASHVRMMLGKGGVDGFAEFEQPAPTKPAKRKGGRQ